MSNNKGMILIETLLLFVVVSVLILIVISCILSIHQVHEREEELFQNEEIKQVYQSEAGLYLD